MTAIPDTVATRPETRRIVHALEDLVEARE